MVGTRPSDTSILCKETPFSTIGLSMKGAVHWWETDEGLPSRFRDEVRRFWRLYFSNIKGAKLASLHQDLDEVTTRMAARKTDVAYPPGYLTIDMKEPKERMIRIAERRADEIWEKPLAAPAIDISNLEGKAEIAIRWFSKAKVDFDLFVRSGKGWLYFANRETDQGHFGKDQRTGKDYEVATLKYVKVADLENSIWINWYAGASDQPAGEVLIQIGDVKAVGTFSFEGVNTGNRGASGGTHAERVRSKHWVRVSVKDILTQ